MKIKIVMQGNCRDIFHKQALQINFDKKVKVKDIRNKLIEIIKHKHLANKAYISLVKASAFCSQHDEIVNDNYLLNNDKIITIIPPIGGG